MASIATVLLYLLLIVSLNCHVSSLETNQTFEPLNEMQKMKLIKEYLQNINKHVKKTITSLDGDIIDCVLFHKQPAFYHPLLKGKIPMEPPKRTTELHSTREIIKNFQSWNTNGEKCPQATIPIKRSTQENFIRARAKFIRSIDDEHAVVFAPSGRYFGAKASLSLWTPQIADPREFSLSQIWVSTGKRGVDLNTIEVGWHAYPRMNGDSRPRLFVYWTADSYQHTGCYNLLCPGFVHTNHRIALGAPFSPLSTYNGPQYEATFKIEKDPNNGNWLLLFGSKNEEIGYWPSELFNLLNDSATRVSFGGEVLNWNSLGNHTATQMGSGHFAEEQFGKAAFVRNLEVFDSENKSIPLDNLKIVTERPDCYNVQLGRTRKTFGTYFYFGGPGLSNSCR